MITSPIMTSSDNCRYRHRGSAADFSYLRSREMQSSLLVQQISAVPCEDCPSGTGASSYGLFAACTSQGECDKKGTHTTGGVSSAAALTFAVKTCLNYQVSMCPEHVMSHLLFFWYWIPVEYKLVSMRFFLFFLLTSCYLELWCILIRLFSVK